MPVLISLGVGDGEDRVSRTKRKMPWLKSMLTSHLAKLLITMPVEGRGAAWAPMSRIADRFETGALVCADSEAARRPVGLDPRRPRFEIGDKWTGPVMADDAPLRGAAAADLFFNRIQRGNRRYAGLRDARSPPRASST